jgi:subtilisin family serine protease
VTRSRIAAFAIALTVFCASAVSASAADYIVVLKDSVADSGAVAAEHGHRYGLVRTNTYRYALKGYAAAIPDPVVGRLASDPRVAFVTRDGVVRAAAGQPCPSGSDPNRCQVVTRANRRIGATDSSARSGDGRGTVPINVAVLDSGIDLTHPDLRVAGGVDCSTGNAGFGDTFGHGTEVAGTIGALDNGFGTVGVAPGATLWSVRVLSKQNIASKSSLLCGVDWVTATRTDANPANDISLANMSIVGPGDEDDGNCGRTNKDPLHLAICRATAAGVTFVVAAGNDSADAADFFPASYDEVITVGGMADTDGQAGGLGGPIDCDPTQQDDVAAPFSNFGVDVDIAAPAFCVGTTAVGSSYISVGGTSFASPLVAGTIALCLASGKKPCTGLTPGQMAAKIRADATAYNQANPDYGFQGDPLHPIAGKYYGYLIRAGLY